VIYQSRFIGLKMLLYCPLYRQTNKIIKIKGFFLQIFNCLPRIKVSVITTLLLLLSGFIHAEKYDDIHIEAAPTWVEIRDITLTEDIPVDEINDGVFYQLLDSQRKVSASEKIVSYSRYVETVANQAGVDIPHK